MRQLENVSEELAASYFSSREVVSQKFPGSEISSENPYWQVNTPLYSAVQPGRDVGRPGGGSAVRPLHSRPGPLLHPEARDQQPADRQRQTGPAYVVHQSGSKKFDFIKRCSVLTLTVQRLLWELPVTVAVIPAHAWLEDGLYWWRRARASHPATDVAKHGHSWKRLCVEQTVSAALPWQLEQSAAQVRAHMEAFRPQHSDFSDMKEVASRALVGILLQFCVLTGQVCEALGRGVRTLELSQLISPTILVPAGQALKLRGRSGATPSGEKIFEN